MRKNPSLVRRYQQGARLVAPAGGSVACKSDASGYLLGAQEAGDGIARLGAASKPIFDARGVEMNLCRLLEGIVGPDDLDETPVAGQPLIDHHDAVARHLLL